MVMRWQSAINPGMWNTLLTLSVWCRQQLGPLNSSWPYETNSILRAPSPSMLPLSPHWWQNAKYATLPPSSLPKDSGAVLYSAYIISLYTCKLRNVERQGAGRVNAASMTSVTDWIRDERKKVKRGGRFEKGPGYFFPLSSYIIKAL